MSNQENGNNSVIPESPAGKKLKARLVDDRTLEGIEHLLARIDTLEQAVEKLTVLMEQAPGLVAMTADIADDTISKASDRGVDVDERLKNALIIAEKLSSNAMVEKLDSILKLTDQLPGIIAMTADVADEVMRDAVEQGFDLQTIAGTASAANYALAKAKAEEPPRLGLFGLIGALRDKDRQKALGFLMNFLKYFGKKL